nr:LuxR family transcriptional regulator [Cryptosporangium arvum]
MRTQCVGCGTTDANTNEPYRRRGLPVTRGRCGVRHRRNRWRQRSGGNVHDELVGREAELAVIDEVLNRTRPGLFFRGESGIGKTALLRESTHRAGQQGYTVLWCRGVQHEQALRYSGLHQALHPLLSGTPELPPSERQAMETLFGISDGPSPCHSLVRRAALGLLVRAASRTPVLLVLDDFDALDPDSVDVVEHVLEHRGEAPLVVLAAAGTGTAGPLGVARWDLAGLSDAAASALVEAVAPRLAAVDRDVVRDLAQGNPLALAEWSRNLMDHNVPLGTCRYDLIDFPVRLTQAFGVSRHKFPRRTSRLLLLVAAFDGDIADLPGEEGELWRAAAVLGLTRSDLCPAEQAGVVTVERGEVLFCHPLTRAVHYGTASPAARVEVHRAFADTLTPDSDRVVWHRAAATEGRDDLLAARLHAIGEKARRSGTVARAATAYEWAARLSTASDAAAYRLGLAADAALRSGHRRLGAQLISEARSLADGPAAVPDLILPEYYARLMNDVPGLSADDLLDGLPELPSTHRGLATMIAAMDVYNSGDPGGKAERIEGATLRLGSAADDPLRVITLSVVAPQRHARELIPIVRRLSGPAAELESTYLMVGMGGAAEALRLIPEAERCYRAAVAASVTDSSLLERCMSMVRHASLLTLTGAFAEALAEAEDVHRLAVRLDLTEVAASSAATAARVYAWQGNVPAAAEALTRSTRLAHLAHPHPATLTEVASARAAVALVQGRPADAVHALLGVAEHRIWAGATIGDLAEAASKLDRGFAVVDTVKSVAEDADVFASDLLRHLTLRARALGGESALFDAALAVPGEERFPVEWARTRLAYGEWLRRGRHKIRARSHLAAAMAVFARVEAVPWRDRAAAEMRAAGGAVESSGMDSDGHPGRVVLTPQERQVARLAGGGLSNRDIAGRLALSPRTVGTHLSNAYAKLGIRGRAELAALVRDRPEPETTGVAAQTRSSR